MSYSRAISPVAQGLVQDDESESVKISCHRQTMTWSPNQCLVILLSTLESPSGRILSLLRGISQGSCITGFHLSIHLLLPSLNIYFTLILFLFWSQYIHCFQVSNTFLSFSKPVGFRQCGSGTKGQRVLYIFPALQCVPA